jgi:SAM-dependent methyltransferase
MDIRAIDWNEAWKRQQSGVFDDGWNRAYWDKRAPHFAMSREGGPYVERFIELVNPEPQWRVLDVGCGSGTLAVPLASRVREITALDISSVMLDSLRVRCEQHEIDNVAPVRASWTDDWQSLALEPHDVVIASRSLVVSDLRQAIEKLNRFALRRVCISTPAGEGPLDPAMFRAIGRRRRFGADYIYVYNLLYQMGLQANLHFITYRENKSYRDKDSVFTALRCRIGELLPQEEKILREYIDSAFSCRDGRWRRIVPRTVKWAVMWWDRL